MYAILLLLFLIGCCKYETRCVDHRVYVQEGNDWVDVRRGCDIK